MFARGETSALQIDSLRLVAEPNRTAREIFKRRIRPALRRAGLDLVQWPGTSHDKMRSVLLDRLGVDLIIDVGANVGQYAGLVRAFGYQGEIFSFEPMLAEYEQLSAAASRDPLWHTSRSAVGAEQGETTINVAGNSISSSLLPMMDRHRAIAPNSKYVSQQVVPIARLDSLVEPDYLAERTAFLKVDTQGYETMVLDGAKDILHLIAGIELEMSLVPLYDGQELMPALLDRLCRSGFRLTEISSGLNDRHTGETLQVDGIFTRGLRTI